ncbi:unnamed protein product, partial [Pylaiella littoralis]
HIIWPKYVWFVLACTRYTHIVWYDMVRSDAYNLSGPNAYTHCRVHPTGSTHERTNEYMDVQRQIRTNAVGGRMTGRSH